MSSRELLLGLLSAKRPRPETKIVGLALMALGPGDHGIALVAEASGVSRAAVGRARGRLIKSEWIRPHPDHSILSFDSSTKLFQVGQELFKEADDD